MPDPAKKGSTVTFTLKSNEVLQTSTVTTQIYYPNDPIPKDVTLSYLGNDTWQGSITIPDGIDGTAAICAKGADLAGNNGTADKTFRVDTCNASFNAAEFPDPTNGVVTVTIAPTEKLQDPPSVNVVAASVVNLTYYQYKANEGLYGVFKCRR